MILKLPQSLQLLYALIIIIKFQLHLTLYIIFIDFLKDKYELCQWFHIYIYDFLITTAL